MTEVAILGGIQPGQAIHFRGIVDTKYFEFSLLSLAAAAHLSCPSSRRRCQPLHFSLHVEEGWQTTSRSGRLTMSESGFSSSHMGFRPAASNGAALQHFRLSLEFGAESLRAVLNTQHLCEIRYLERPELIDALHIRPGSCTLLELSLPADRAERQQEPRQELHEKDGENEGDEEERQQVLRGEEQRESAHTRTQSPSESAEPLILKRPLSYVGPVVVQREERYEEKILEKMQEARRYSVREERPAASAIQRYEQVDRETVRQVRSGRREDTRYLRELREWRRQRHALFQFKRPVYTLSFPSIAMELESDEQEREHEEEEGDEEETSIESSRSDSGRSAHLESSPIQIEWVGNAAATPEPHTLNWECLAVGDGHAAGDAERDAAGDDKEEFDCKINSAVAQPDEQREAEAQDESREESTSVTPFQLRATTSKEPSGRHSTSKENGDFSSDAKKPQKKSKWPKCHCRSRHRGNRRSTKCRWGGELLSCVSDVN